MPNRLRFNPRGRVLPVAMLAIAVTGSLLAAEAFLRWTNGRIARSDRISPGLTQPDPVLGWRLSPRWRGTHRQHDFSASYSINASGFRGADVRLHPPGAGMVAIVGDSFTFGTGVDDDEPFPQRLEAQSRNVRIYNFAVPGYSTDQEVLLVERELLSYRPQLVLVVVYLGNDLFDNQLSEALQVRRPKPRFTLDGGTLRLHSTFGAGSGDAASRTLGQMVLGQGPGSGTWWERLQTRSHLARAVGDALPAGRGEDPALEHRHRDAVDLFWALIDRLRERSEPAGARIALVLLAGRSHVEAPGSLSARFQEFFRSRLAREAASHRIDVIDVAGAMRERYASERAAWFYPNEGHLNATGHGVVAELVRGWLTTQGAATPK